MLPSNFKHLLIILSLFTEVVFAQNNKVDSLTILFKKAKHDTTRGNIYIALSDEFFLSKPDTIIPLSQLIIKLADKHKDEKNIALLNKYLFFKAEALNNIGGINAERGDMKTALAFLNNSLEIRQKTGNEIQIAQSMNNIAGIYEFLGESEKALTLFNKSLKIQKKLNDKKGIARVMNNIAGIFQDKGDVLRALDYYFKCLKLQEEVDDKNGQAILFNNIGNIYSRQNNYKSALKYYAKSLDQHKKIGNKKRIALELNNMASVYSQMGDINKAMLFLKRSLEIREKLDDKEGITQTLINMGNIFKKRGEISKAFEYFKKSLIISREIENNQGLIHSQHSLGDIYFIQGNYKMARQYIDSSLSEAKKTSIIDYIRMCEFSLSKIDSATHNFENAFNHYKSYIILRDSINNAEIQKSSTRNQLNYEFEKKEAIIKEQQKKERAIALEKSRFQQIIIWSVVTGLALVILFSVFVFRSLKITHKQKIIIEEKQREILDSIHYAKRIQESLLTSEKYIASNLERLSKKS